MGRAIKSKGSVATKPKEVREAPVPAFNETQELMDAHGLPDRLAELVGRYPSKKAACAAWGINPNQLFRYLRGENDPAYSLVTRIAHIEDVTVDWLSGVAEHRFIDSHGGAILGPAQQDAEFVRLPLLDVHAAAGHGAWNDSENVKKMLAFPRDWIASDIGVGPEHLSMIYVAGDSMLPRFRHGDVVMLNALDRDVSADGIYVFVQEGKLLVKRLQRLPGHRIRVCSENDRYAPYDLDESALGDHGADSTFVVGRVVWAGIHV